jgi:nucleoid-associated protein YgaU
VRKDLKIGMLIGVALVAGATVIISISSSSVESRIIEKTSITSPDGTDLAEVIRPIASDRLAGLEKRTGEEPVYSVGPRIHVVASGETLTGISKEYYGTVDGKQTIINANKNAISNADTLREGTRLVIP